MRDVLCGCHNVHVLPWLSALKFKPTGVFVEVMARDDLLPDPRLEDKGVCDATDELVFNL